VDLGDKSLAFLDQINTTHDVSALNRDCLGDIPFQAVIRIGGHN